MPMNPTNALLSVAHLVANRDLGRLLPEVPAALVAIVGAERALFALFDDTGAIEEVATHGLRWAAGSPLPISNSLIADVLRSGQLQQCTTADLDAVQDRRASVQRFALRFVLAMPVLVRGRVAGVLYADSTNQVDGADPARVDLFRALAAIVGLAVENARLASEQQLRTMLVAKLAHDLRNPLMALQLTSAWLSDLVTPDHDAVVEDLDAATQSMLASCRSALRLAQLDGGAIEAQPVPTDLSALANTQGRLYLAVARQYQLDIVCHGAGLPIAHTWPDRVRLVLENLLFNAIKHADRGSRVTLAIRMRDDAGPPSPTLRPSSMGRLFAALAQVTPAAGTPFVEISVHNVGRPIPPALLPHVFEEWVRGDETGRADGASGLGLAIVERCVGSLGGRTWVESDPVSGTRFSFTVPLLGHVRESTTTPSWSGVLSDLPVSG
jgi:signal transduction histidine kinase